MWRTAYETACAETGVEVRDDLPSADGDSFDAPGNVFERFSRRLSDDDVRAVTLAATRCHGLAHLLIPYNAVTSLGATYLAQAMQNGLNSLVTIDLSHNAIDGGGAVAIAEATKASSSVSYLSLAGNCLGGACGVALAGMLQGNGHLTKLDLKNTDLDMKALVLLCGSLATNSTLCSLDIGNPCMSIPDDVNYAVHHLSLALHQNRTLETLAMNHFGIVDLHLATLLPALCASGVTSLSLRGNKLSQDAGTHLGRLLERKQDMRLLDVSANRLRDVGAVSLAACVARHTALAALFLESNTIGEAGLNALAEAIAHCKALRAVTLWGNDFDNNAVSKLYSIKDRLDALDHLDFGICLVDGRPAVFRE